MHVSYACILISMRSVTTCLPPPAPCPRWFHGKISREQAEHLLTPPETGLFLVRGSTNFPGDYTLCVSCLGKVEHYHITYKNNKLSIDAEEFFENLMQLVEVRRRNALGGGCVLTHCTPFCTRSLCCLLVVSSVGVSESVVFQVPIMNRKCQQRMQALVCMREVHEWTLARSLPSIGHWGVLHLKCKPF